VSLALLLAVAPAGVLGQSTPAGASSNSFFPPTHDDVKVLPPTSSFFPPTNDDSQPSNVVEDNPSTPLCPEMVPANHDYDLLENLSVFAGLTGSKGPEDLGINANFGARADINWGFPLLQEYGLGVQAGTSCNYSRTAVRVIRSVDGTRDRTEEFTTVGLFQRTSCGLNWGLVYDLAYEEYWDHWDLSQLRGQVGYDITKNDECGVWGSCPLSSDTASTANQTFTLRPIGEGSVFWRHVWDNQSVTRVWVGVADEHNRFILVAPGLSAVHHPVLFGADVFIPLSDHLAIFGEANFITPNDTGTVTATFGIAYYPGGGAQRMAGSRFAPMLPVANNTTFSMDLHP
jgi:hypothetical protein